MNHSLNGMRRKVNTNAFLLALVVGLIAIILGVSLGWENNKVIPLNPASSAHYNLEPHNHLSFLVNWDGPNYLNIAAHGYTSKIQANFFPLYPLIVHLVKLVVSSAVDSGLIVSWAFFIGAIYFYLKIMKQLYNLDDNSEALRGVLFFVLFPTAVFLLATYTESLFAFLSLGSIYSALQKKHLPAGLFALFATATHVNGIYLLIFMALILWEEGVSIAKILSSVVIGSLGIISYMVYQAAKFHSVLAFLSAQKRHNWFNFNPSHLVNESLTLNGIFLLLLIVSAIYWWRKRKSFSIYSLLYFCICFIGGRDLGGIGRYTLMAFPLEIMLYDYFHDKKLGYPLALALSAIFWTFFSLHYSGGYTGG